MRNGKQFIIEVLSEDGSKLVRHPSLPVFASKSEAEAAERLMNGGGIVTQIGNCTGIVRGSPYSRRGAGRSDPCAALPKFTVRRGGYVQHVCGVHVKTYRSMNATLARNAQTLGETYVPWYDITAYVESAK